MVSPRHSGETRARLIARGALLVGLLSIVLAAVHCQNGGFSFVGGDPVGGDLTPDPGIDDGPGDDNGGNGGGGGGDGGGGGGGGTEPPPVTGEIGIDSYVYVTTEPGSAAAGAGARQWPGEAILFTKTARTDLTPYEGVRVFVTGPDNVDHELATNSAGLWSFRAEDGGPAVIDLTDEDGIPILANQPVTLSATNLTPWPSADLTIPTAGLSGPVDVIVEGRGER